MSVLEYLCRCNNCEKIMYDENPQVDSVMKDPEDYNMDEKIWNMEQFVSEDGETFWGCPICETDKYLTDL